MSLLTDMPIKDFNNLLASDTPAPGGGSTAALSGALASALTMMVVNLSLGKKSYQALDEKIKNKIALDYKIVAELNSELIELVDEDAKAFNLVMKAMKLPKETESERAKRETSIREASLCALKIPLIVAEKCLLILQHQKDIALYGNINAVSDIGVGALMALSGLEGAVLNVKINLSGITDKSVETSTLGNINQYLVKGKELKAEIISIVNNRINEL